MADAISALDRSGCGAIPVLSASGSHPVGWSDYRVALDNFAASRTEPPAGVR